MKKIIILSIIVTCGFVITADAQNNKTKSSAPKKTKIIKGDELPATEPVIYRKDINKPLDMPAPEKKVVTPAPEVKMPPKPNPVVIKSTN